MIWALNFFGNFFFSSLYPQTYEQTFDDPFTKVGTLASKLSGHPLILRWFCHWLTVLLIVHRIMEPLTKCNFYRDILTNSIDTQCVHIANSYRWTTQVRSFTKRTTLAVDSKIDEQAHWLLVSFLLDRTSSCGQLACTNSARVGRLIRRI